MFTIIPVKRNGMRDRFAYVPHKDGIQLALNNQRFDADYACGYLPPHYPMPAIPLSVHWPDTGYLDCVYIDSMEYGEDDPYIVAVWDFGKPLANSLIDLVKRGM